MYYMKTTNLFIYLLLCTPNSTFPSYRQLTFKLLKRKTFIMYHQVNIQKFCAQLTIHLCVLRSSQNKQPLFRYTASIYRFLKLKHRQFTTGKQWVYMSDRYIFVLQRLTSNVAGRNYVLFGTC